METIEKSVEIINDLIQINNDRIEGFERAAKDLGEGDQDLKSIFESSRRESLQNVQELKMAASQAGADTEQGTSVAGTLHRAWIDVKATFTGHDRKSVLAECERGEDAIKKAYKDALLENSLGPELSRVLLSQQQGINASHDRIKLLRDSQR
jgi:uncharacterized protein (TIGR02284 family)